MLGLKSLIPLRWLAALVGLITLSSCVVVEEGPRPIPDDGPRVCTAEYVPVCASDGRDRRTFSNACLARRAGYDVERRGECRRERPQKPQICTRQYDPVCGERRGNRRTFGNACEADAAGFRIVGQGECRRQIPDEDRAACTREYAPVCARRGDSIRTFGNACEARVNDYRIISDGAC